MASPSEIVRPVLEVPAALLDKCCVIIQVETGALAGEVIESLEHLSALAGIGASGPPEHARRQFVHGGYKPSPSFVVRSHLVRPRGRLASRFAHRPSLPSHKRALLRLQRSLSPSPPTPGARDGQRRGENEFE
jgi:hypothetical protein